MIVLLDVCHAGASAGTASAANDDAVRKFSYSIWGEYGHAIPGYLEKGRQYSLESSSLKGGLFSLAISDLLDKRQLPNQGGPIVWMICIVGPNVVRQSGGTQTPWLSRNEIFGDLDLF